MKRRPGEFQFEGAAEDRICESGEQRVLICEGAEGAIIPEIAYVQQGDKAWFAWGKPDQLDESLSCGDREVQIVERFELLDLEERELNGQTIKVPRGGRWVLEGPAQRSDTKNANGRTYPREIWDKNIADDHSAAQASIRERGMLGHLEHPKDGRTDGKEGALVTTKATLREDGVVWASFELLDTPNGLILQEYTRKGIKWGVSSRGTGSVAETGRVNPGDFRFECWDGVMRPSVQGANPKVAAGGGRRRVAEKEANAGQPADAGVAADATGLTEDAQAVLSRVTSLVETPIDEADPGARRRLRESLVSVMGELVDGTLPVANVMACVRAASLKLAALEAAGTQPVDEALEAALRDAETSEGDPSDTGYAAVVEDLTHRATTSAEEVEGLREQLEEAESRCLRLTWRVQELSEQLAEVTSVRDGMTARLTLAEELLAERPASADAGEIEEAVADAIAEVPELAKVEHLLKLAQSRESVPTLAESLLPLVVRAPRVRAPEAAKPKPEPVVEDEAKPDLRRRTLPRGEVVSESNIGPREAPKTTASRGVKLAAGAVSGMKK